MPPWISWQGHRKSCRGRYAPVALSFHFITSIVAEEQAATAQPLYQSPAPLAVIVRLRLPPSTPRVLFTIFPRIDVRDPYKRLGISREASQEEIQAARNFLINKYAGHQPSVDAIESAHDKIILQSLMERKRPKINVGKKVREIKQSRVVKTITSRFQSPSRNFIIKTTVAFVALGVLTILFPTEEGPTLQVAISLLASMYFIHERLQSRIRAFLYGTGAFAFSWLLGTFLMVSVIPPLLQGPRSLEVTTSLISYILLWVSSTYLKVGNEWDVRMQVN
ncbi:hypothetical protein Taro_012959 [Colocasia esculenta]|uniref:Protein CHAPERONE-LIKE PROTEIN OF POR1, chloroplastic n=1 Tax=Colocasia esculenta TaxID=4460 RepID=A0A843UHC9_COLES|nr:hypothetical protein [Colocasia esculenta]